MQQVVDWLSMSWYNLAYMIERGCRATECNDSGPLFAMGRTLATPGGLNVCAEAEVAPSELFQRHQSGDWGDLCEEDLEANEAALEYGGRLFSAYDLPTTARVWVITEADRSATTLLTPMEY